ncbi:DinB family protein [Bacillus thuringiensis]|uniref:DinB family protein n=1 Tax=Bacillus thuringiensis TaxID=1428 RepID=UPI0030003B5C
MVWEANTITKLLIEQFKITRGCFIRVIESLPKERMDIQPDCFNNNLRWQIGHALTIVEQYMFEFPKTTAFLPEEYMDFFGEGTSPLNWAENVPTVDELILLLKEQLSRICRLPPKKLNGTMKKAILGYYNTTDLVSMLLLHEAYHLGQIQAMNQVIKYEKSVLL